MSSNQLINLQMLILEIKFYIDDLYNRLFSQPFTSMIEKQNDSENQNIKYQDLKQSDDLEYIKHNLNEILLINLQNFKENPLEGDNFLLLNLINMINIYKNRNPSLGTEYESLGINSNIINYNQDAFSARKIFNIEKVYFTKPVTKRKIFNFRVDCIRKRIKTHFHRYVYNKLNRLLSLTENHNIVFKLPKNFISEISIIHNKNLFQKTVAEIYSMDLVYNESNHLNHNKDVIKRTDIKEFKDFTSRNFREIYYEYLDSSEFTRDMKQIKFKDGENYANQFRKIAINLISFYFGGIGNR